MTNKKRLTLSIKINNRNIGQWKNIKQKTCLSTIELIKKISNNIEVVIS